MELKFFSLEEVKDFTKQLKGTRGGGKPGEGDDANTGQQPGGPGAPPPLMPPQGQPQVFSPQAGATFNPPKQQQPGNAFPGGGGGDPVVAGFIDRIGQRIDWAIQNDQGMDAMLGWFRGQCGPEAANATMDQIRQNFLPKLPAPTLDNIAKLMNA